MARPSASQLEALEADYEELLLAALGECARGKWGLFGQNDGVVAKMNPRERRRHQHSDVRELLDLGTEIEALRQRLGIAEPFDLHRRLMVARSATDVHTVGEPKLAQRWLDELRTEPPLQAQFKI